jgi:deoxyribodipyrimidine photo-lyase
MTTVGHSAPVIVWFREDLRLSDNPALSAAAATGAPVIPLFVLEDEPPARAIGAASRWWLDKSLIALGHSLKQLGSRLVLRRGDAAEIVEALVEATGARSVVWNCAYEAKAATRDARLEAALLRRGVAVHTFDAALLTPPGSVQTADGGAYQVFTAFWRAARPRLFDVSALPAPPCLHAPRPWPKSDRLADWGLHPRKPDWSGGFKDWVPGETGAAERLDDFLERGLRGYAENRDRPDREGVSRLSPHLRWGEISPRQVWRGVQVAVEMGLAPERDGEKFLAELGWRDFNWQLLHARPNLATHNVHPKFDRLPWRRDAATFDAWTKGQTGYPIVDAGMRELWATGFMHNRVRMIAASFLTKHLMIDWREGEAWFWDTLVDADAANNPANWQWVAGSGADAAPYFRIFNPTLQREKFDPDRAYVRRWVPELDTPDYPRPIVRHEDARERALAGYASLKTAGEAANSA